MFKKLIFIVILALAGQSAGARTIDFAGHTWNVKSSDGDLAGPGPNLFSDSENNVWVDDNGALHLKITQQDGLWYCAEVYLDESLGYGKYAWKLKSAIDDLDPNVTLGLFTWSDKPRYAHREIDIEFGRWGNASDNTNAQFVVQPSDDDGHLQRWTVPAGTKKTVDQFDWTADKIKFKGKSGDTVLDSWTFNNAADIPVPGDEVPHINLWLYQGQPPGNGKSVEVVIKAFTFTPD